jgi:ATP-dependent helicase/nuclease subunit B
MQLVFGLSLDDEFFRHEVPPYGGIVYAGPKKLLIHLEEFFGVSGAQPVDEYLRIEQYRQVIDAELKQNPERFFAASFQSDSFATAEYILKLRDELLLGAWDFTRETEMPERLEAIVALEQLIEHQDRSFHAGMADRWHQVCLAIPNRNHPFTGIQVQDPPQYLPHIIHRVLMLLSDNGVDIVYASAFEPINDGSDLAKFQHILYHGPTEKVPLKGDGSLLIVQGHSDTALAEWMASLLKKNQNFKPVIVAADKANSLNQAISMDGLPALGLNTASTSRPALQMLRLAPVFLWNPIDPSKILEFVSLSVKPIDDELAAVIAACLAEKPGLHSDLWEQSIAEFFSHRSDESLKLQYNCWFNRPRFEYYSQAPKSAAKELFEYILDWSQSSQEDSVKSLQEQANQIIQLLDEFPESTITALGLERIIKTVLQAAPIQLSTKEFGHLPFVSQTGAFTHTADEIVWWNFIRHEPDYFFSPWYRQELDWLAAKQITVGSPAQENDRVIYQRKRPVLAAQKRLILLIPHTILAKETQPHPLLGDLSAAFENLSGITYELNTEIPLAFSRQFTTPSFDQTVHNKLPTPKPFISLRPERKLEARDTESYSSLETLLFYPHIWVFRYKIKLRKSPILSIKGQRTLMGNLAHTFFEQLLKTPDILQASKEALDQWFDDQAITLLEKEGASLLLYGREQERIQFIRKLKTAAWTFISTLRNNQWRVKAIEHPLEGAIEGVPIVGRADIILERGQERAVIDMKWKRTPQLVETVKNQEDLQLAIYSRLLSSGEDWAHTAYFSIEQASFVARNNAAFAEIKPIMPDTNHAAVQEFMLKRIMETYRWRMTQIEQGQVEARCQETAGALEIHYEGQLLELLEMKRSDQFYDDYPVLIHQVQ